MCATALFMLMVRPPQARRPYEIYAVIIDKVYGFGRHESFSPTRWQF
jgi:hypothetical protein